MIHPPTHRPNIHYTRCPSFYPSALFLWGSMLIRRPVSSARISSTVNIQSSSFFYYYYLYKRRQASPPSPSVTQPHASLSVCMSVTPSLLSHSACPNIHATNMYVDIIIALPHPPLWCPATKPFRSHPIRPHSAAVSPLESHPHFNIYYAHDECVLIFGG